MNKTQIKELSTQLKDIAKDLSFLGHPRYPLKELYQLFPQHKEFIDQLDDLSVPFNVNVADKKRAMDTFLNNLEGADIPYPMKKIFTLRIEDYRTLLSMMENFNSVFFYKHCRSLYGSSHENISDDSFKHFLEEVSSNFSPDKNEHKLQGKEALTYLRDKLSETFDPKSFEVKASSSLLSDSSAGRRTLKLSLHKEYSIGQLNIFLVHEGWVHLGTSLNGAAQIDNPWLSTWAPRTTVLQEGLALLSELVTGVMTKERWERVILRHLVTTMAERGSSIREVYDFLRHQEMDDLDAFKLSLRVFRGVPLEGGMAFTKELLYLHGMIKLINHLCFYKTDLRSLWVGKVSFEEHGVLVNHWDELNPQIKYFPDQMIAPDAHQRLEALKKLTHKFFNQDLR